MEKTRFTVVVDNKEALEKAIQYVNFQTGSDYELIHYEQDKVGLGTIEVSKDKIIPEYLFMMGVRYYIHVTHAKRNT